MSQIYHNTRPTLPDPSTAPELFEGLLTRRIAAWCIDVVAMSLIISTVAIIGLIAGLLTFGLAWLALIIVLPLTIVLYYGASLGSARRATFGMQAMDIVLTPTQGQPLNGSLAFVHAALFWITIWISWPISLLVTLFTPRRQMLHDLILGTLMVRRSPMDRHWRSQGARTAAAY